jgi:ATP adenylyltransferase
MATEVRDLWDGIVERYDHAQAAQAASLTETNTAVLMDGGVKFVLKVAAALRDKPKPPAGASAASGAGAERAWRNPFLPPDPNLFVRHLSPTHSLVLNKFNVVPHHALVITRDFQPQEDPLNAGDLEATWAVMAAMPCGGLAYFNCGPASGASQPHKHVQVVPLPLLPPPAGVDDDPPFWPTIVASSASAPTGVVLDLPSLPFVSFVARLDPAAASGKVLAGVYDALMLRAAAFVGAQARREAAVASYNLVMTHHFMMVVPRRHEGAGPVSCNAMAFAGSFFVRSTEELEYVRRAGPLHILESVGYPREAAP